MMKSILPLTLAGALTTPVVGYEEICMKSEAAFKASFAVQILSRRDARKLDKTPPADAPVESVQSKNVLRRGEGECVPNPAKKPGDRIRVVVIPTDAESFPCHSDAGEDGDLFLNPDDDLGGALRFMTDGDADAPQCHLVSEERMHSECNSSLDGMQNIGCAQWKPEARRGIVGEIVADARGYGALGAALDEGADINHPGKDGETPLHIAARTNLDGYLTRLIARGADARAADDRGRRPLLTAINAGHADAARILLEAGADPNQTDDDGACPLHTAAAAGRLDLVRLLVDNGANVNAKIGDNGKNALMIAKSRGHGRVVKYLLQVGATWNADSREDANAEKTFGGGQTALHLAARENRTDRIQRLLREKVNINARDDQGRTPLMTAVEKGHQESVWMLMAAGADANLPRLDGYFPLHLAVEDGRRDLVRALINGRKTNVKARHLQNGKTPSELAAELFQRNGSGGYAGIRWDLLKREKSR